MENIFTNIYNTKRWGNNKSKDYEGSSGQGSSVKYNEKYIEIVKKVISDYKINNIVDLGCGDFRIEKENQLKSAKSFKAQVAVQEQVRSRPYKKY